MQASEPSKSRRLVELIRKDAYRMSILSDVSRLPLKNCYVAAGFVRNLVWDHLHQKEATELNDIDVIFFDQDKRAQAKGERAASDLKRVSPGVNWQLKNQAVMHLRNHHSPYKSIADAMSYWPEKETAVAVKISGNGLISLVAPYGLDSLFRGEITQGDKVDRRVFEQRVENKRWLISWPKLKIIQ